MVKIVNINDMSDLRKMAKFKLQFTSKKSYLFYENTFIIISNNSNSY